MKTLLLLLMIMVEIPGYIKETSAQNFTARHNNYLADSLINVIAPSAKLLTIESDSTFYGGTSHTWNYRYASWDGQNSTYYFLHTTQNSVVYDSSNNIIWVGVTYLTLPWIDSDSAGPSMNAVRPSTSTQPAATSSATAACWAARSTSGIEFTWPLLAACCLLAPG